VVPGAGFYVSSVYEAFEFYMVTNMITAQDTVMGSLRMMNAVINHVYGLPAGGVNDDTFHVRVISHGEVGMNETTTVDTQELAVGKMRTTFRAGGKTVQVAVFAKTFQCLMRLGYMEFLASDGGRR
jgi:hypothetical protein